MTPVIQARAVRGLLRGRALRDKSRDVHQEVADVTQDVFCALFAHGGRALKAWDPRRGLSLANFVGLIAERQVASILRNGRRDPWKEQPGDLDELEREAEPVPGPEPQMHARRALELLLDRMRESLSPRGLELFHRLYVEEEPTESVAASLGMTTDAVYAWRNRASKLIRRFAREIDDAPLDGSERRRNSIGPHDG